MPEIEEIISKIPPDKLQRFILSQVKKNSDLYNAILRNFRENAEKAGKAEEKEESREEIDDGRNEAEILNIDKLPDSDTLYQKLNIALNLMQTENYEKAVETCQSMITELFQWQQKLGSYFIQFISAEFVSTLFSILEVAAAYVNKEKLYHYCLFELKSRKSENVNSYFINYFHHFCSKLAVSLDHNAFLNLQDDLLSILDDKGGDEAKNILERKIDFYMRLNMEDKAWNVIEKNLQVESFCLKIVERKIAAHDLNSAKKIINDHIERQCKNPNSYVSSIWYDMLLDIFHKENDVTEMRDQAYDSLRKKLAIKRRQKS